MSTVIWNLAWFVVGLPVIGFLLPIAFVYTPATAWRWLWRRASTVTGWAMWL